MEKMCGVARKSDRCLLDMVNFDVLQCVAVCCSVLQCVAVCSDISLLDMVNLLVCGLLRD